MYLFQQFVNVWWDTSNRFIGSVHLAIPVIAWIFEFGVATPATHHVSLTFLTKTYEWNVTGPTRTRVVSNLHTTFMLYNVLQFDSYSSKRHSEADKQIKFVIFVAQNLYASSRLDRFFLNGLKLDIFQAFTHFLFHRL
jgi:hypothetical protein